MRPRNGLRPRGLVAPRDALLARCVRLALDCPSLKVGTRPKTAAEIAPQLMFLGVPRDGWATSPSYSPKLTKRATDVAESRNSIHGSGCETESGID
jgi:hypothetical protein